MRIAVDGPCGAGKSTLGRLLAQRLGYIYIDTGAMYRAVALAAGRRGVALDDLPALEALARGLEMTFVRGLGGQRLLLDGVDVTEAIRTPEVSEGASRASAAPGVRRALVALQRRMGSDGNVVMDGRDIGTVVFPEAELKFFLDADVSERAKRRWDEDRGRGRQTEFDAVLREIRERDQRDTTRADSPLKAAEDAVRIDSTGLSVEEVLASLLEHVANRSGAGLAVKGP